MKSAEGRGRTLDEAVDAALIELGESRRNVDVKVVTEMRLRRPQEARPRLPPMAHPTRLPRPPAPTSRSCSHTWESGPP
jgi:hypothetical protein